MASREQIDLRKFVAPEFIFGNGALALAGRYAKNFGAGKVLVVSDEGVRRAGWTEKVTDCLKKEYIPYIVFTDITPNPKVSEVMKGADLYRREDCDVIVAVGGGSSIDTAKGVGIVSTNGGNVLDFEGVDQIPVPGPPLICIPTTAGSSADVSQFAVISENRTYRKAILGSKMLVPDTSLIDPDTTMTMTEELTIFTGLDALTHAVEAYVSNASSPITDLFAIDAIRILYQNIPLVMQYPGNVVARGMMMLGSLEAGLAFSNASLGATHALSHSLVGVKDLCHGESNAMYLAPVVEFNYEAVPQKYDRISEAFGLDLTGLAMGDRKASLMKALKNLLATCGVTRTLSQAGFGRDMIPEMARKAQHDICIATNPRQMSLRDLEKIYEGTL